MDIKPIDLVNQVSHLASLPDICFKVNELAEDSGASTNDFKNLIETDPALSAKLLKIANSAFYSYSTDVADLNRAIMLIGTQGLRDITWSCYAIDEFSQLSSEYVDMYAFWRHSLFVGTVARVLANKCHIIHKDRLFLSGLLHDIGHLVMYQLIPEEMTAIFKRMADRNEQAFVSEKSVLGFNHATLGYKLLKSWELPESIYQSVAFHHQPGKAEAHRLEAAILHLADAFAKKSNIFGHKVEDQMHIDTNAWKITALSDKITESVIDLSKEQFHEVEKLFLRPLNMQPAA